MRRLTLLAPACAVLTACPPPTPPPDPPATWQPGTVYRQTRAPNERGYADVRGLVHAHSPYSHDACDGEPRNDAGVLDATCLADFRRGLCQAQHDFVFLTDHRGSFADAEFPDVLLHDPALGDQLVTRGGGPTASWLSCPDAPAALVLAGTESGTMPVGLEGHVGTAATRGGLYGNTDNGTLDLFHAQGSINLVAHTEDWTVDELSDLHLDGFEMFNLHRAALRNAGIAADLVFNYVDKGLFDGLPHPELFLLSFDLSDPLYMQSWGTVLSRGHRRVTTMGTDCHRNTFTSLLQDGERIDSYRRMMSMFSNHLLVQPRGDGTWDDVELKAALRAGRLYGVLEFLGFAEGFDFHAREGDAVKELGGEASLARGVTLSASMPKVKQLSTEGDQPQLTLVLLRAIDGGWEEVAQVTQGTLTHTATVAGAYRVEVRMSPRHLRPWVGTRAGWLRAERQWVMSNPIYVTP